MRALPHSLLSDSGIEQILIDRNRFTSPESGIWEMLPSKIANLVASCGPARLLNLVGGNPARTTASHGPGIESCRHVSNEMLDA